MVFVGTRVPVQSLLDYLEAGRPLAEFLGDFPSVTRNQAIAVLEQRKTSLQPMRVLLDECLPRRLRIELAGHEVSTVPEMGWAGVKNGELLQRAAGHFDVFLTVDGSIKYQQNVAALGIFVVALRGKQQRRYALMPLMPAVRDAFHDVEPGRIVEIGD